jgi:hypothetical protein
VAAEYSKLAEGATSPLFRAHYERIERQYREHANAELLAAEQDSGASRKPTASPH